MRIIDLANPEKCEQVEASTLIPESPLAKYDGVIKEFQDEFSAEKFDELTIDEKFACLTVPTVLQGIFEAVQKQNGGATNRLLSNQIIDNPSSDIVPTEHRFEAAEIGKSFPAAWRDINQGGKGGALEEVVGYCLSSYNEAQFNNGLSVVLDDGSITRPDIIAFAPLDKTGYSVLGNADLCSFLGKEQELMRASDLEGMSIEIRRRERYLKDSRAKTMHPGEFDVNSWYGGGLLNYRFNDAAVIMKDIFDSEERDA